MIRTLSRHSPQSKELLAHIRSELRKRRVRLVFSRTRMVRFDGKQLTAAYFQRPMGRKWGIIRIGTGNRKPINILMNLVHEYVHFMDWSTNHRRWRSSRGDIIEGASYVSVEEEVEAESLRMLREWGIPANHRAVKARSRSYIAWLRLTEVG